MAEAAAHAVQRVDETAGQPRAAGGRCDLAGALAGPRRRSSAASPSRCSPAITASPSASVRLSVRGRGADGGEFRRRRHGDHLVSKLASGFARVEAARAGAAGLASRCTPAMVTAVFLPHRARHRLAHGAGRAMPWPPRRRRDGRLPMLRWPRRFACAALMGRRSALGRPRHRRRRCRRSCASASRSMRRSSCIADCSTIPWPRPAALGELARYSDAGANAAARAPRSVLLDGTRKTAAEPAATGQLAPDSLSHAVPAAARPNSGYRRNCR